MKLKLPIMMPAAQGDATGFVDRYACAACPSRKFCLLGEMNDLDIPRIGPMIRMPRRIARNTTLFNIGDKQNAVYAIRFGQFKVCGLDPTGDELVHRFHMPGDLLGLDAIATGRHIFRAIALEDSAVCETRYATLDELICVEPELRSHFLRAMSQDALDEYCRSAILVNLRSDQRLARFLLNMSDRYALLGYSARAFRLTMSRRDIASYLGITVESVSRSITRFNVNGWIRVTQRDVEITERATLDAMAYTREEAGAPRVNVLGQPVSHHFPKEPDGEHCTLPASTHG